MEKKYLVVNAGSTSRRYAIFSNGKNIYNLHLKDFNNKFNPVDYLLNLILKKKIISNKNEIDKIGFRIVAPGFLKTEIINSRYLKKLRRYREIAPVHISPLLKEIEYIKKSFPKIKLIGVSDSKFHVTMPMQAKIYGIPLSDANKFKIYRYGYHGLSASSVLSQVKDKRIIICHLGGGSSVTAVKNGKSLDTSMGFTPLEGIIGSTRSGNFDVGALLYMGNKLGFGKLLDYFSFESGLNGLGGNSDMRLLLKSKDKKAKLALDKYIYDVKKQIGSCLSILGGLDLLVFTGAIGEGSWEIREKICDGLDELNIKLDKKKNRENKEIFIHKGKVKIKLVKIDEFEEIYKEMLKF